MAEAYMQSEDYDPDAPATDTRPPMSEFDLTAELLLDISNQLRLQRVEMANRAGGNFKPDLRSGPRTAMDVVERRKSLKDHYTLVGRLLPHKAQEMAERLEQLD